MKNDKVLKALSIIGVYIFFSLGICIAWAFCSTETLPLLLPHTISMYKICGALDMFFIILPATLEASFCVALAIVFGTGDQEKSRVRFSQDMFRRYKIVCIVCIGCVAVLTVSSELGRPLVSNYKKYLEHQEALARDYERNGGNMFRAENFDMAYQYAHLALELDPSSEVAKRLLADATIAREANKIAIANSEESLKNDEALSEEGYTVHELGILAEKAYSEKSWFDAHYYAQTAVNIAEARNTLLPHLKEIASDAWNKLEIPSGTVQTEEERLYALKLSGYGALMRGDNLHAYYVFMSLSRHSRKMANDPDVVRYLSIAQERMQNAYFFIDETIGIKDFESANMVNFAIKNKDGTTDIIHIKGIVAVAGDAGTVQYLRGFCMITIDPLGNMKRKLYDENVKMVSVNAEDFDGVIDLPKDAITVPYLLLNSVDRYDNKFVNKAESNTSDVPDTLVLPLSCEDFELLKEASKGANLMDISALIKIVLKADKYGYSSEVFAQVLLDRLLYPLLILCTFMLLASFAWNFRIKQDIPFQTTWILSFPILTACAIIMMNIILWLYSVMNHVFVGVAGLAASPIFGVIIYTALFIISSLIFLARNNIDPEVESTPSNL